MTSRSFLISAVACIMLILPAALRAQDLDSVILAAERLEDRRERLRLQDEIQLYIDGNDSYFRRLSTGMSEEYLNRIDNELKAVDMKWNFFFQTNQEKIMAMEPVFAMVNTYLPQRDSLHVAVDSLRGRLERIKAMDAAIAYFAAKIVEYKEMKDNADRLSMAPQTASLLEKLKSREQIMAGETESRYQEVAISEGLDSLLAARMDSLETCYAEIRNYSEKIQQSEYKPFMQRIKDYLLSFAAVAVLLMFLSMMKAKIDAARQMKENLKKAREQMAQNDDSIPSI